MAKCLKCGISLERYLQSGLFKYGQEDELMAWHQSFLWEPGMMLGWGCSEYIPEKVVKVVEDKKFVFITLQDFKTRVADIEKLQFFIKSISYMYEEGSWIIESGKAKDSKDFNVHIHLLVKIRPQVKNHKKVMNTKWMRYRDTNLYEKDYYDIKQHRDVESMPPYEEWLKEKREYFINDLKGSHKNTVDLELSGNF